MTPSNKSLKSVTKSELGKKLKVLVNESPPNESTPFNTTAELLHELEVHQVELEMQNRELRETQALHEELRDRYANLYDSAPVSYLTIEASTRIREINLTGAALLGKERSRLTGRYFNSFVASEHRTRLSEHLRICGQSGKRDITELQLRTHDKRSFEVDITTEPFSDPRGSGLLFHIVMSDAAERKNAEMLRRRHDHLEEMLRGQARYIQSTTEALATEAEEHRRTEGELRQMEAGYQAIF